MGKALQHSLLSYAKQMYLRVHVEYRIAESHTMGINILQEKQEVISLIRSLEDSDICIT